MERNTKGQFVKGGQLSAEERIIKSRVLSESWKKRDDYIGDIKDTHPRIFNSWRSIRFCQRGKAAGCVEEWKSFRSFYNDVEPSYEKGLVLRRKDILLPWGPDNFMWVSSSEAGEARTSIMLEYDGRALSLKQWSNELNISLSAIKNRYFKHRDDFSTEEILFGRKTKRGSKVPFDLLSRPEQIRAKASKLVSSYKSKDRKNGLQVCDIDIDWMIKNILLKPCVYCGDTHKIGCDRIDNKRGHTKDNVVPCCVECNSARNNNFTYHEMLILGKTIAKIKCDRGIVLDEYKDAYFDEWSSRDLEYRRKRTMHATYQFSLNGDLIAEYNSVDEAAKSLGITAKAVSAACTGKSHGTHKCAGFFWSHNKDDKFI